jgi:hypothetical protein
MCVHVRACSRSTAQQTATTAGGLELGGHDGIVGTIGFGGKHSCVSTSWRHPFATGRGVVADCCLLRMRKCVIGILVLATAPDFDRVLDGATPGR